MKKRFNYEDGKKKEREPTEREKKDDIFPAYDDLKRLSLGIPESDQAMVRAQVKKDETFSKRWKEFATGRGLEDQVDNLLDLNDDALETMRDRLVQITQRNPDFSQDLFYFLSPLQDEEVKLDEKATDKQMRACNRLGFYSFSYFLQQLDVINRAASGKLNQPRK